MKELLYGRELLFSELPKNLQEAIKEDQFKVEMTNSFIVKDATLFLRQ